MSDALNAGDTLFVDALVDTALNVVQFSNNTPAHLCCLPDILAGLARSTMKFGLQR